MVEKLNISSEINIYSVIIALAVFTLEIFAIEYNISEIFCVRNIFLCLF